MNLPRKVVNYAIGTIISCGEKMIELGEKTSKDRWEKIDVISLLQLLGVNNCQPLLHMSKIQVYLYTTYKRVSNVSICYMINPTLHINKVFREQVIKNS